MNITITVTGLDSVDQRLIKLGASLHDFSGALATLGRSLIAFYSDTVFNSQGTTLGSRWEPLAQSTQDYKSKHWPGRQPEVRTGTMQKSFYANSTTDTLFVGNSAPYFAYQQMGTGVGGGRSGSVFKLGSLARAYSMDGGGRGRNLPARPMIGVNNTVNAMIKTVLTADIKAKIASTGL